MKQLLITLFLINSLFLNYSLYAASESKVDYFLDTYKTYRSFDKLAVALPGVVQQSLMQHQAQIPQDNLHVFQEISQILITSIQRSAQDTDFRQMLRDELINNFSDAEMDAIAQWYESDLGQRVWQYELASATPEGIAEGLAYVQKLQETPAREARQAMAVAIDNAFAMTDSQVESSLRANSRVAATVVNALTCGKGPSAEFIYQQSAAGRDAVKQAYAPMIQGSILYAYRFLKDSELQKVIDESKKSHYVKLGRLELSIFDRMFDLADGVAIESLKKASFLADRCPSQ